MIRRVPSLLNLRSINVQNTGLIECSVQSKALPNSAWFCFCLAWVLSTDFASIWAGFDAADCAEWLAANWYAEVNTYRRWRRRCFYSILESMRTCLSKRGDNVTVLTQLNRWLSWLGLAPVKAWRFKLKPASPETMRPPYMMISSCIYISSALVF